MPERECMHIVVQDPTLVVRARHEGRGLFLGGDIESLVVDSLERPLNDCISLLLCLENTLVQIDILHTHSITIEYHTAKYSLGRTEYYVFLINQAVHLGSETHELGNTKPIMFVLEDRIQYPLVEVEE